VPASPNRCCHLEVERLELRLDLSVFFAADAYPDLAPPVTFTTDNRTVFTATADFDKDGHQDMASIRLSGDITVYRNDGLGGFSAITLIPSGVSIGPFGTNIATGDFNSDGNADIVAFGNGDGNSTPQLRVFLGNGHGQFSSGTVIAGVTGAYVLATADLNKDGATDVIAKTDGGLNVLLGQPGGTLASPVNYELFDVVLALAAADFNNDGNTDVVATGFPSGHASVFLGTATGALNSPTDVILLDATQIGNGSFTGVASIAAGDFNGDGKPDLVAEGVDSGFFRSLIFAAGAGDGSFAAPVVVNSNLLLEEGPVIGDFDGDGKLDLAFTNSGVVGEPSTLGAQGAEILLGNGHGGFTPVGAFVAGGAIKDGIAGADFNGDNRTDLVIGRFQGGIDVVESRPPLVGGRDNSLSPTVAVSGSTDGAARLYSNDPFGVLQQVGAILAFPGLSGQVRAATADINGDGSPDTILVTGPGTAIQVAAGSGADNLTVLVQPVDPFGGGFTGGGFVTAADLDGDGKAEFAVTPDQGGGPRVSIYSLVNGAAAIKANFLAIDDANFRGGARPALGDVNHDGAPDLLVAAGFGGGPRVALFDGTTVLGSRTKLVNDFFAFPEDAQTLRNGAFAALGDVNGDGFADLIFGGGPGGGPRVYILSGQILMAGSPNLFTQPVANFFVANNSADRGGVRLAVKDADGDNLADVVAGSGEDSKANVRIYLGKNFNTIGEPGTFQDLAVFGGTVLASGVFVG
jgi:hypothetical protein